MFRAALTYQLILAVAVGPMLCCCSAGKSLARAPVSPSAPEPAATRLASEPVPHACCAHKHSAAEPSSDRTTPAEPAAPCGKCPCKGQGGKAELTHVAPTATQADLSQFLRTLEFDDYLSLALPVVPEFVLVPAARPGGWGGHATSPAEQILYAHHNLRC